VGSWTTVGSSVDRRRSSRDCSERRTDPPGVRGFLPSEWRVARLAADGRTNRQIAQSLYVTLKTVETHLAHAYAKLGIARRGDLPGALGTDITSTAD